MQLGPSGGIRRARLGLDTKDVAVAEQHRPDVGVTERCGPLGDPLQDGGSDRPDGR